MNTRSYVLALALGAAVPTAALAQAESSMGVYGSWWDTDDANDAWGVGVKGRIGMFELRGTWYDKFDVRSGVEIESIPIEAGIAWNFAPHLAVNPYVGAGVGYHFMDTNLGSVDDEVGWYAVLGGEFGMPAGFAMIGEVMYRDVDATLENGFREKVDLSGFAVNIGAGWRF